MNEWKQTEEKLHYTFTSKNRQNASHSEMERDRAYSMIGIEN